MSPQQQMAEQQTLDQIKAADRLIRQAMPADSRTNSAELLGAVVIALAINTASNKPKAPSVP